MQISQQTLDIIDKIVKQLSHRFVFSYHDVEDIEQQARIIALEGLKNYDGVRPLENYLFIHVKNRLCNFKRDNFVRLQGPCEKCGSFDKNRKICKEHNDFTKCTSYVKWQANNKGKLNLAYPIEFSHVDDNNESSMHSILLAEHIIQNKELSLLFNKYIPVEHRHTYLKMLYGYKVAAQAKNIIIHLLQDILQKYQ